MKKNRLIDGFCLVKIPGGFADSFPVGENQNLVFLEFCLHFQKMSPPTPSIFLLNQPERGIKLYFSKVEFVGFNITRFSKERQKNAPFV
jgi:hypothetical protein